MRVSVSFSVRKIGGKYVPGGLPRLTNPKRRKAEDQEEFSVQAAIGVESNHKPNTV